MNLRRIISLCLLVLFCFASFSFPIESNELIESITIYVDDDGAADYTSIQDAIDNASDGDTVFVYSGTYKECLKINKRITLRGENIETTIVDGGGLNPIVRINADSVTICGFTIQNSSSESGSAVKIYSKSNNIYENKIINNYFGIILNEGRNFIRNNNISSNNARGILLNSGCPSVIIENNIVSHNRYGGIYIYFLSENTVIRGNNINSNSAGIYLNSADKIDISENTISYNSEGIHLYESSLNTINLNSISNNKVGIWSYQSSTIYECNNFIMNEDDLDLRRDLVRDLMDNSDSSEWFSNYWNGPRLFPKLIIGWWGRFRWDPYAWLPRLPYVHIDWEPAKEPYEI